MRTVCANVNGCIILLAARPLNLSAFPSVFFKTDCLVT